MADTYESLQEELNKEYAKLGELNAEMERGYAHLIEKEVDERNRKRETAYTCIKELKNRWNAIGKNEANARAKAAGFKVGDRVAFSAMNMLMGPLVASTSEGAVVMFRGEMMIKLDKPGWTSVGMRKYVQILPGWRKVEK